MRARFSTLILAALAWGAPALAFAAGGEHAGAHGHALRFVDVVAGKESVQFWGAVLNCLLLVVILYAFAAKPLREFLAGRRREMEQAMREAAEAKAQAQARYEEYTARLAQLDRELAKLRTDIERAAEEDRQRILADAEHAAARMQRDTETLVRQHAEALERNIRREVVEAAMTAAERVLRESIGLEDQRRLAEAYREDVARPRPARGQA
jgi:F-type H+-transporting ATPase subunit b